MKSKIKVLRTTLYILIFSCSSSLWAQSDITEIGRLPQQVFETSGLLSYNGRLLTHNDSGNAPALYELDPSTLEIVRTVTIDNVVNRDWEDLAQDDEYIYIGDFGNNNGDRQDLRILKISKVAYNTSDRVEAETIDFSYEDQTDFTTTEDSDFDAEAFFSLDDNLIILTKQWQQNGTVAYRIPKLPGAFLAERMDSFQVNGLVTGATYNEETNQLSLVGYSQFLFPFYVLVTDVSDDAIFNGTQTKTNLEVGQAQVEAIAITDTDEFYITSEEFSNPPLVNAPSRLFTFTLDSEEEENPPEENPTGKNPIDQELLVFKNYGAPLLNYRLNTERPITGMGIFDVSGRMVSYVPLEFISDEPLDISTFRQSLYYLTFFLVDDAISAPFFKD